MNNNVGIQILQWNVYLLKYAPKNDKGGFNALPNSVAVDLSVMETQNMVG